MLCTDQSLQTSVGYEYVVSRNSAYVSWQFKSLDHDGIRPQKDYIHSLLLPLLNVYCFNLAGLRYSSKLAGYINSTKMFRLKYRTTTIR